MWILALINVSGIVSRFWVRVHEIRVHEIKAYKINHLFIYYLFNKGPVGYPEDLSAIYVYVTYNPIKFQLRGLYSIVGVLSTRR